MTDRDFRRQQEDQERLEQQAVQGLMFLAASGHEDEADALAFAGGLYGIWKQQIRINERKVA